MCGQNTEQTQRQRSCMWMHIVGRRAKLIIYSQLRSTALHISIHMQYTVGRLRLRVHRSNAELITRRVSPVTTTGRTYNSHPEWACHGTYSCIFKQPSCRGCGEAARIDMRMHRAKLLWSVVSFHMKPLRFQSPGKRNLPASALHLPSLH